MGNLVCRVILMLFIVGCFTMLMMGFAFIVAFFGEAF